MDPNTGKVVETLEPWSSGEYVLAWSPDGAWLVTNINCWNLDSRKRRYLHDGYWSSAACFSPDTSLLASAFQSGTIRLCDADTLQVLGEIYLLSDDQYVAISPDGHYRGSPGIEEELRYVVQTENGQGTLTPQEFSGKYGWKNEPERVRLLAD